MCGDGWQTYPFPLAPSPFPIAMLLQKEGILWAAIGTGLLGLSMASTFPLAMSLLSSAGEMRTYTLVFCKSKALAVISPQGREGITNCVACNTL